METITLHEMEVDIKEKRVKVGSEISINPALILENHSIRGLPLHQCLSKEEREKIPKKCIGAFGSNVVISTENGFEYLSVVESTSYIQSLKEKNN